MGCRVSAQHKSADVPANADDFGATAIGEGQPVEVFDLALPSDPPEFKLTAPWVLPEVCNVFSRPQNKNYAGVKYAISLTIRFRAKSLELVLLLICQFVSFHDPYRHDFMGMHYEIKPIIAIDGQAPLISFYGVSLPCLA